ncbi:MAG: MBOAT family protein [Oscillibacter sp.]|jgi:alginate O-acetyltransferase complex protein AlgI|nr:MBOAT family protein [Oscillibacter sp.]
MAFQSLAFLAFLAVTLAACLGAGRRSVRAGEALLAAASAVFYLWSFSSRALAGFAVLCLGAAVSWAAARAMAGGQGRRRGIFAAAAGYHIAVLLYFKYTGFFTAGAYSPAWAPLGLSFFTFQQLWFLKEVWAGTYSRQQLRTLTPMRYGLFSLFFPTVSSGPILRPGDFFPQLSGGKFLHPDWRDGAAGLYAIALGMGKKVLLADSLAVVVNNGWSAPETLNAPEAWLVILGYTLQLYFDFSGYCDIAAGAARLLGLRLPQNFDSPYRALSVGEFWRRWHITLTSFLRECVYFPLGGSRRGKGRTYVNILLVFLLSGLWHGAGWTFLLWGALHGLAQAGERAWGGRREKLPAALRWGLTFLFVNLAWVFFRAPDVGAAGALLRSAALGGLARPGDWLFKGMFTSAVEAAAVLVPALAPGRYLLAAALLYGAALTAALAPGSTIRRMDTFLPTAWRCAAVLAVFAWAVLSFGGGTAFLYTNF